MPSEQSPPSETEYLHSNGSAQRGRPGRRPGLVAAVAAGVAGVVALGGWAAVSLMSTGSQPAEAVPGNAVGFLSIDLDPSAAQKIEAVRMLRTFPALSEELDISDRDDLRRWMFERVIDDTSCAGVAYDTDVEPWIGERLALAGVPAGAGGTAPIPLVAVQVTDPEAAVRGIEKLAACDDSARLGVATVGDYALLSDSQEHADAIADSVGEATLAEDADYRKWMQRVGRPGIVSMYLAPGAMAYLADVQDRMTEELAAEGGTDNPMLPAESELAAMRRQMEKLSADFEGMAGAVRFADGALEVELVGETAPGDLAGAGEGAGVGELPSTTAVALGVPLPQAWAQSALDALGDLSGGSAGSVDELLRDAEAMTGLELPEDLERLLGDGFAVAVDSRLDVDAVAQDPGSAPVGLRISGDPAEITAVLDRLRTRFGPQTQRLVVEEGQDVVAMGLDPDYVTELVGRGNLGTQAVFRNVVPDAARAGATLFVDFDAVAGWVSDGMPDAGEGRRFLENLEPLRALGMSSWADDDGSERWLLRLTTD